MANGYSYKRDGESVKEKERRRMRNTAWGLRLCKSISFLWRTLFWLAFFFLFSSLVDTAIVIACAVLCVSAGVLFVMFWFFNIPCTSFCNYSENKAFPMNRWRGKRRKRTREKLPIHSIVTARTRMNRTTRSIQGAHIHTHLIHSRCDLLLCAHIHSLFLFRLIDDIIVLLWFCFCFCAFTTRRKLKIACIFVTATDINERRWAQHTVSQPATSVPISNINNLIIDYDPKCKCIEITTNWLAGISADAQTLKHSNTGAHNNNNTFSVCR